MKEEIKTPQQILAQAREEFSRLDEGDFFDTGSDGNLYFHPDKVADWWLLKFQSFIEAEIAREVIEKCEPATKHPAKFNYAPEWYVGYNQAKEETIAHLKELLVTLKR